LNPGMATHYVRLGFQQMMRLCTWHFLCALAVAIAVDLSAAQDRVGDLSGVWEARRNFGPDVHGRLTIVQCGPDWQAMIDGRTAPVSVGNNEISLTLPGGQGSFRGMISQDRTSIVGFWKQPPTVFIGNAFVSPLTLKKQGPSQWVGNVVPLNDRMTVYLVVKQNPDGSFATFVRNPERNAGLFFSPDRLERQGDSVLLKKRENSTDKILAQGRYDATNTVMSFYLPDLGGSFDFRRAGPESEFYPQGQTPAPYVYHKPLQRDDGWPVASLKDVGISQPAMENLIRTILASPDDSVHAPNFQGILIARHGKLVLEEYFHGFSADRPHETRSAAKSLAAVLVGAAMNARESIDLSMPVYKTVYGGSLPGDLDARKTRITLRHLLTMSSGLDCNDWDNRTPASEDNMQAQTQDPDWRHFTLTSPMAREPGTLSLYCAGAVNLVGEVLAKATARTDPELFDTLVAKPLQFGRYDMNLAPNGDVYFGGGMYFLPRDFMKFAQLMLNGSEWNGQRILSQDFVQQAISTETHITDRTHGARKYGYLFWINDYFYKNRKIEGFFLAGNGGQIVMGIPALDLAMAFYGGSYSDKGTFLAQDDYVPNLILPAAQEGR
jgi:CubicO group peptidase (beta-lactamase class C family)